MAKSKGSVSVTDDSTPKPVTTKAAAPAGAKGEDGLSDREREYYSNQRAGRRLRVLAGRFSSQPMNVEYKAALKQAAEAL